jgi:hypothetical protein
MDAPSYNIWRGRIAESLYRNRNGWIDTHSHIILVGHTLTFGSPFVVGSTVGVPGDFDVNDGPSEVCFGGTGRHHPQAIHMHIAEHVPEALPSVQRDEHTVRVHCESSSGFDFKLIKN